MSDKTTAFNEQAQHDIDPEETREWLEALDAVMEIEGSQRAHDLLEKLIEKARRNGAYLPYSATTAYLNSIPRHQQKAAPGDPELEWRLRSIIRWNAMAMVVRANREDATIGGHIASFASAATLYDVGFNHFWHAPSDEPEHKHGGDLIYIQGHSSPGIYARAFLEGRISEEQLDLFRQEVNGNGLSSYPHPWLMPDFWQFPTVSMGLGPITAIYQARFLKYLQARGLADTAQRKVWCFIGDGETDEPETLGAIALAAREKLDNLIFVVNCNLQRLDGPVRGNAKIIQELESDFRGAGWRVIKVIWGSYWDDLLARDKEDKLLKVMEETIDGEYQNYKAKGGAYTREAFFGKDPDVKAMVAHMSDKDIWRLNRGGHDPHKVYAAYHEAVHTKGQPTVILAKTIKGYGMGTQGEGMNKAHQQKKLDEAHLRGFRDRFHLPISDEDVDQARYYKPAEDSPELQYLQERRRALGGYLPQRRSQSALLAVPELKQFEKLLVDSGDRDYSTTMAFVRFLTELVRDKNIGQHIVPIVPDEARTFGMDGLFRQLGIYSSVGQLYEPQDKDQVMFYREDAAGQILEEGITEAGAMSSFIAAGTSYANSGVPMVPFYIFYSMFGFQRIGDLAWAAGDARARGFLLGATAGRTTLNGEGLQHQDGHSLVLASTVPNCLSYDPAFGFEVVTLIQEGLRRMYVEDESLYYYLTLSNQNTHQPAMPEGCREGILKGLYVLDQQPSPDLHLLSSGAIMQEAMAAAELLASDFGVCANLWSATSFNELARDMRHCERYNRLHPTEPAQQSYIGQCLNDGLPVIAATDYQQSYAEQVAKAVAGPYTVLGTDGYGRSDSREQLRSFFEVDRYHIVVAALKALADQQHTDIDAHSVAKAIKQYDIDADSTDPAKR
ncbi:pyruvate dehydrogenase (acetyl-transferring), homodimeric type [gamma proteobacterium HTCC5015]|nr:pyruvate dehydrogenase (acetyl-transferring), homodimeric type [gamma proteobacterium HTCC5015]